MFSKRTDWIHESLEPWQQGNCVDLTLSNPTKAGFTYPPELLARLAAPPTGYEPLALGLPEARRAVADYYKGRGVACSPDQVVIGASTSDLYAALFSLLCDPGDSIAVPQPSYPLLPFVADLSGVSLVPYSLYEADSFALLPLPDFAEPPPRAYVVIAPNNPTGNYLTAPELARLESRCCSQNAALIVDEVFADYPLEPESNSLRHVRTEDCLGFVLSGLSKVALLPQAKLSWAVVHGPAPLVATALQRLEVVADTFLSAAPAWQHSLAATLTEAQPLATSVRSRARANLATLDELIGHTPLSRPRVGGGWVVLLRLPRLKTDVDWANELARVQGVRVQPGSVYRLAGTYATLSLLTPPGDFREGVRRICEYVAAKANIKF